MTNVLYLYENEMPTVSLMKEGNEKEGLEQYFKSIFVSVKNLHRSDLNEADVLVLIRPTEILSYHAACWVKKSGRLVITFCDDDLYNAQTDSALDASRVSFFRKTLKKSDLIWSSSPRIAEKYKQYTTYKRGVVTDTTVDEKNIYPHYGDNDKVKIVYAAGPSHSVLFEEMVSPILNDLFCQCGNCFSITFVGVHPKLPDLKCKDATIRFVPLMSLEGYRQYMERENFDIGLAPLHTDEFSKCKYFNKFIEYSMFGIVGIYSNTEPYTYVIEDRKNGMLVSNDPEEWLRAMTEMIQNEALRKCCAVNAQDLLRTRFSVEANKDRFVKQLPELFQEHKNENKVVGVGKFALALVGYRLLHSILYLTTGIRYLQTNGLRQLLNKVKNHFFHKKAFSK